MTNLIKIPVLLLFPFLSYGQMKGLSSQPCEIYIIDGKVIEFKSPTQKLQERVRNLEHKIDSICGNSVTKPIYFKSSTLLSGDSCIVFRTEAASVNLDSNFKRLKFNNGVSHMCGDPGNLYLDNGQLRLKPDLRFNGGLPFYGDEGIAGTNRDVKLIVNSDSCFMIGGESLPILNPDYTTEKFIKVKDANGSVRKVKATIRYKCTSEDLGSFARIPSKKWEIQSVWVNDLPIDLKSIIR